MYKLMGEDDTIHDLTSLHIAKMLMGYEEREYDFNLVG